jgi:hypothetical protein
VYREASGDLRVVDTYTQFIENIKQSHAADGGVSRQTAEYHG